MESVSASSVAMLPLEDTPTAATLPAVSVCRTPNALAITSTEHLISYAVLAYFRDQQCMPRLVAMHPLRLLTLPSLCWPSYEIADLGRVALRSLTLIECQQMGSTADVMVCE